MKEILAPWIDSVLTVVGHRGVCITQNNRIRDFLEEGEPPPGSLRGWWWSQGARVRARNDLRLREWSGRLGLELKREHFVVMVARELALRWARSLEEEASVESLTSQDARFFVARIQRATASRFLDAAAD